METAVSSQAESAYQRSTPQTMPDPRLSAPAAELHSTVSLLARARSGDGGALEELLARCLPPLRRWARGRLPTVARGALDTQDVIQDSVINALAHLDHFEPRHEGALQAYLRQSVMNRICDEVRRIGRRPLQNELTEAEPSKSPSPLEIAIGREGIARYERALQKLRPGDREAIVGRFEMQHDYRELAVMLGKGNANSARTVVTRALTKLMEYMEHED